MKMKLSIYNRYVSDSNRIIVYNTKYSNAISFDGGYSIEEIKNNMIEDSTDELVELGFLVDDDIDEIECEKTNYYSMKFNSSETMNVMLIMTYSCNCSCKYCFESLNTYPNSEEDIDSVIEYLVYLYKKNSCKNMDLHFFGGEPTLKTDKMVDIIGKLRSRGLLINANVITNGTLLNEFSVKKLIKNDIRTFQITLDGPKEIHDMRRPMKNKQSSWDMIMKNLELLSEYNASISIRINIDSENVEYIADICNSLPRSVIENPYTIIYMSPVVGCMKKTFNDTMQDRIRYLKHAWKIVERNELPIQITPPAYAPCPYSSKEQAFYIDLSGNIYTCGGFVGKKDKIERKLGEYTTKYCDRIEYVPPDNCFKCSIYPICMGGCKFEEAEFGAHCQFEYLSEIHDEYYKKYTDR